MKLKNVSFEQWQRNHPPDHDDRWCRELYPFHVFSKIDFDDLKIGEEQCIEFNGINYYAQISKIELQDNDRFRTTFNIATFPKSKTQEWNNRKWNNSFQIVYTQDYDFITVFSKKEDPSREFVVRFMKGNFQRISENRSIPISELLFRTLILYISEDGFPGGKHYEKYLISKEGVRELPIHGQFHNNKTGYFSPIYSLGRDLWICYSFTEEKAHRIAFYNSNQCRRIIVIYCNPTYSNHHRCNYPETSIVSLYEFSNLISTVTRKKYEAHIRFLQNHLNPQGSYDSDSLLKEINNPTKVFYEILKSELMEALGVMKITPKNDLDFFHSLCALNLINAFLTGKRGNDHLNSRQEKLFKDMYSFKKYLSDIVTDRINHQVFSIPIFITKDLIIIEIKGFQFSFHNIPLNQTLLEYERSSQNKEITWKEKRLQPIAPLLFNYSRSLRN